MDYLLVLGTLSLVLGASVAQTWPRSAAAFIGDDVQLQCRPPADNPNTLTIWQFGALGGGNTLSYIYLSNNANPPLSPYQISSVTPHDLTIPDITTNLAGEYVCSIPANDNAQVVDVVILENFECGMVTEAEGEVTDEGHVVTFTCSVEYYGNSQLIPSLEWYRDSELIMDQDAQDSTTPSVEYGQRTITRVYNTSTEIAHDGVSHECRLYWEGAADDPTSTAPLHNETCTMSYRVRHTPQHMHVEHNGETYTTGDLMYVQVGDNITCTVSAYPTADMLWERETGEGPATPVVDGSVDNQLVLTVTGDMDNGAVHEYECNASQAGSQLTDNMLVKFTVGEDPNPPNAKASASLLYAAPILLVLTAVFYITHCSSLN